VSNLAFPLAALAAGYDATQIGLLTAVSAIAQLLVRTTIPAMGRRFPDRTLVSAASGLLAVSCAVVVASTAPVPFVAGELLQGAARGYFWSGSQLHGVRTSDSALKAIAKLNLLSSAGLLLGPLTAGALASRSSTMALTVAAGGAVLGTAAGMFMARLPVLRPTSTQGRDQTWRRPAVLQGSLASVGAGAWSALVVSFLPVVLAGEQPPFVVGVLVAIANGANVLASASVGLLRRDRMGVWLVGSTIANGLGLALVPAAAESIPLAAAALVLCGLGSGALLTLGPALATEGVADDERAAAIAVTGGSRAAALLVTPLAVAAAVTVVPLGAAVAGIGLLLAVPPRIRRAG
jgi:MFS family permease